MSSPISEAQVFLAPVLDRTQLLSLRNASLIQRLSTSLPSPPPEDTKNLTRAVLIHALQLLQEIHASSEPTSSLHPDPNKLVNATEARTIVCLLDLLVLEGIYPSLSVGVGIPLERRARNFLLPATRKKVIEVEDNRDLQILRSVADGLLQILENTNGSVGKTIRERCLVDLLAGFGELAFGIGGTDTWKVRWGKLVDSTPTPLLLPQLLSLLHPSTPPYFRKELTRTLSTLPITRPNAIRHILELFLSTVSDSALSVDALSNASRIIGSVPTSIDASEYFSRVCPQLLSLLDGKDPGLARAAGFVIAELLGRRGAIEKVIEREVVDVIVAGLNPVQNQKGLSQDPVIIIDENRKTSSALLAFEDALPLPQKNSLIQEITGRPSLASNLPDFIQEDSPLVSEEVLTTTLHRISMLLSSHPSPSVSQRLLPPVILPLWALLSYAKQTSRSSWHERVLSLLKTYMKTTPAIKGDSILSTLHHNILFAGTYWEFGPGGSGGIEIRPRASDKGLDMSAIENRVEDFLSLLSDSGIAEGELNDFFLSILRIWLQRRNGDGEDPIVMFTTLKVLQEMISRHEGALAKSPTQTLQIVKGVLDEYVDWKESLRKASEEAAGLGPSLGGLGRIVSGVAPRMSPKQKEGRFIDEGDEDDQDEETERIETVMMTLSLLSVLISSPGTKLTPVDERLITTLQPPLSYISNPSKTNADLSSLAVNIVSLLSLHDPVTTTPTSSLTEQQKESYILALSYLRDPLIPVRAHGLHLLRELILAISPVVDIPSTMRLLIGMLKDGDSFVYLNVVKCLTALTDKHSKTVTRMLVSAYIDDAPGMERLGLDERLRIGEALLSTVQRLGSALVGETAATIGDGMLGIVSRRRKREGGAGGEEWGSDAEDELEDADEATREKRRQESAYKTRIVRGWQGINHTEDLRIRTSALSILGIAIETNAQGLGQRVLTEAIDTSLSILTLEVGAEKAILRRAAVICIGSILKSLVGLDDDNTDNEERWRDGIWEVVRGHVDDLRRVLGYVRGADNDGLVREQSGVVTDNLEAVVERWMLGHRQGVRRGQIVEIGDISLGGLRVL